MNKIKVLLMAALVMMTSLTMKAQQDMTFEQMIPVRVLMPVNKDVKGDALTILYNRLNQAVSLNGLGSSTDESRFLIVTSITILSKTATPTIPVQYKAELEMSFYFVDNVKKIILSETTITKIGMDDNENKAVAKAIKSIQARDPKLKKLINNGKSRALEYYQAIEGAESEQSESDPDVQWINE